MKTLRAICLCIVVTITASASAQTTEELEELKGAPTLTVAEVKSRAPELLGKVVKLRFNHRGHQAAAAGMTGAGTKQMSGGLLQVAPGEQRPAYGLTVLILPDAMSWYRKLPPAGAHDLSVYVRVTSAADPTIALTRENRAQNVTKVTALGKELRFNRLVWD